MLLASSRTCVRSTRRPRISAVFALGFLLAACEPEPHKGQSADSSVRDLGSTAQGAELPPLPAGAQIGAYYFASFSSRDYDPQITDGGRLIYGRDKDIWAGVRDFYPGGNRGWSEPDAFRRLKPAIGYYDLYSAESPQPCALDGSTFLDGTCVVAEHIRQAKRFGLSYFSFYWFWDNAAAPPGTPKLDDGLESFLKVRDAPQQFPQTDGFSYYLTIAAMPRDLAQINEPGGALDRLLAHFSNSYYLKPAENRPLLFILDGGGTALCPNQLVSPAPTVQEIKHNTEMFIAALRQRANAQGLDPIVLLNSELPYAEAVANADGFSCLHPGGIRQPYSWDLPEDRATFAAFSQNIQPFLTGTMKMTPARSMLPCVTAGFDERPREDVLWYLRSRCPDCPTGPTPDFMSARFFVESNSWAARLAYYVESLRQVRHWMAARPPAADPLNLRRYLTIYAWNEWHEGGILEPALEHVPNSPGIVNEDNLRVTKCTLGLGDTSACPPSP